MNSLAEGEKRLLDALRRICKEETIYFIIFQTEGEIVDYTI